MADNPKPDIRTLAALSRIRVSDDEVARLETELGDILHFVEVVQQVELGDVGATQSAHRNIMREDTDAIEPGTYTDALLDAAPKRTGEHLEVKQVLSHVKKNNA